MFEKPAGSKFLIDRDIPHSLYFHTLPVHSLEEVAHARNQEINQIVRSILFYIGSSTFLLVLISGKKQISWQKLRSYLGISRMRLATEEEVFDVTGFRVGAVSPFGIKTKLRILADKDIFDYNEISTGSGEKNIAIILNSNIIKRIFDTIEIGTFSESE